MSKQPLAQTLSARLTTEDKNMFLAKCAEYQTDPQVMIRDMIRAVNQGTLKILVPQDQLRILKGIHYVN